MNQVLPKVTDLEHLSGPPIKITRVEIPSTPAALPLRTTWGFEVTNEDKARDHYWGWRAESTGHVYVDMEHDKPVEVGGVRLTPSDGAPRALPIPGSLAALLRAKVGFPDVDEAGLEEFPVDATRAAQVKAPSARFVEVEDPAAAAYDQARRFVGRAEASRITGFQPPDKHRLLFKPGTRARELAAERVKQEAEQANRRAAIEAAAIEARRPRTCRELGIVVVTIPIERRELGVPDIVATMARVVENERVEVRAIRRIEGLVPQACDLGNARIEPESFTLVRDASHLERVAQAIDIGLVSRCLQLRQLAGHAPRNLGRIATFERKPSDEALAIAMSLIADGARWFVASGHASVVPRKLFTEQLVRGLRIHPLDFCQLVWTVLTSPLEKFAEDFAEDSVQVVGFPFEVDRGMQPPREDPKAPIQNAAHAAMVGGPNCWIDEGEILESISKKAKR